MSVLRTIRGAAALAALLALVAAAAPQTAPKERVVVFGFASRQLNDLQDRLLRETVLYKIHANGQEIVPVMEIESLFRDESKRFIRRLSRADVRALCNELDAGVAVFGSIAPEDGKRDDEIQQGKSYICALTVFRRDTDTFTDKTVRAAGEKSLYTFFLALSKKIVEQVE